MPTLPRKPMNPETMTIPRDWEGFARDVLGVGEIPAYQSHAMNTINEAAKAGKRVVLTSPPSAVRRPSAPAPSPTSGPTEPREKGVDTRALARALREQRVTIINDSQSPSGLYVLLKIREPGPGMDPRVRDALMRIRKDYPKLSRRGLAQQPYGYAPITAEGYKGALALLAPLLHPRARGEAPRWLPGVSAGQVAQEIDDLLKRFRLGA